MDLRLANRLSLVVMALFPALWGLLGDLNNLTDFSGTATNAVGPMIAMTNTYGNPLQTWRAITSPWAAPPRFFSSWRSKRRRGFSGPSASSS